MPSPKPQAKPRKPPVRQLDPAKWQREHKSKTVTMSDLMFSMAVAIEALPSRTIEREYLDVLFGPTVNAFLARGYLVQHSPTTVYWTKAGSDSIRRHHSAEFHRNPTGRFSAWLTLASYDEIPSASKPLPSESKPKVKARLAS